MFWDDIRLTLVFTVSLLILIATIPVAITGGVIASNYIFFEKMQVCQGIKK
jgi:hypothetical protein